MNWMKWYELPGPSMFLDQIENAVREGKSLVLAIPSNVPSGLWDAVSQRFSEDYHWTPFSPNGETPADQVAGMFGFDTRRAAATPEDLYALSGFQNRIFACESMPTEAWTQWRPFLEVFAEISRQQSILTRSLFMLAADESVLANPPAEDVLLATRRYQGCVNATDSSLFCHQLFQSAIKSRVLRDLRTTLIVELALWDFALMRELVPLDISSLVSPTAVLRAYAEQRGWDSLSESTSPEWAWHQGICHEYEGTQQWHSAYYAVHGNVAAVERRVWRAELKVLFPFIEEQRLRIIERHDRRLRVPHTRRDRSVITDIRDLEMVDIDYQFQMKATVPQLLRDYVRKLWLMRNKLAHGVCLDPNSLTPDLFSFDVDAVVW